MQPRTPHHRHYENWRRLPAEYRSHHFLAVVESLADADPVVSAVPRAERRSVLRADSRAVHQPHPVHGAVCVAVVDSERRAVVAAVVDSERSAYGVAVERAEFDSVDAPERRALRESDDASVREPDNTSERGAYQRPDVSECFGGESFGTSSPIQPCG